MALPLAAAALITTGYSAIKQKQSYDKAAEVDKATAAYNAKVDQAQAKQVELDTIQNIRTQRQSDQAYLSRQVASYASAGVLTDTGSPLAAQITNAGRMEQRIQQEWVNMNQRQQQLYSAAKIGVLEGQAQADADKRMGTLALLNGGAKMASQAFGFYQEGVFS